MSTPSTPFTILIIENHEITAQFISLFLQRSGHQVTIIPDGKTALSHDNLSGFDVILGDIGLPDMNGWDLMKQLRSRTRAYAIAMSGFGGEADVQRSLDSGYQYHLVKPFVPATLEEVLRNARSSRPN
ncbi:MAG: response regulator [Verrucomicrobia bacterium]|nr:response regulator [Verrucomicrobiota bacterium]